MGKIKPERAEVITGDRAYDYPPPNPAQILRGGISWAIRQARIVKQYKAVCRELGVVENTYVTETRIQRNVTECFENYFRGE